MSPEEEKALIEHAKTWIADAEAARDEIPFGFDEDTEMELSLIKIALATLIAQPVKLPDVRIFCNSNKSHRKLIYAVTDAIRAAGYEVQE